MNDGAVSSEEEFDRDPFFSYEGELHPNPNAPRKTLNYAACGGDVEETRLLLAQGADIDSIDDEDHVTPLHLAVVNRYPEVAKPSITSCDVIVGS